MRVKTARKYHDRVALQKEIQRAGNETIKCCREKHIVGADEEVLRSAPICIVGPAESIPISLIRPVETSGGNFPNTRTVVRAFQLILVRVSLPHFDLLSSGAPFKFTEEQRCAKNVGIELEMILAERPHSHITEVIISRPAVNIYGSFHVIHDIDTAATSWDVVSLHTETQ